MISESMSEGVRVRFAPSPTGALHIGGVRTALYNYLFARQHGGRFILRIEDTDQSRFVSGAEAYINEALQWLGIAPDEGVLEGGDFGPYRQSERQAIYQQYAQQLIDGGHAYYAFDTPEELEAMRSRLKEARVANPVYDNVTRTSMNNSLTLSSEAVQEKLNSGTPYVIRLKVPRREEVRLKDLVRGYVVVNSANIDDKVLMKSDGMPTYHLANVVDDHLMKITHVIRGEEWLPSAPLHVLLYRFLGWEDSMPQFAHLPLLLKPDGNGKLSKRDADKHGYPVFPLDYTDAVTGELAIGFREQGYLPEALINFLALLGWNPGTEQEMFTLQELIDKFSIERIGKAGAKFDIDKARWFNQQYLKQKSDADLGEGLLRILDKENIACSRERAEEICGLLKERVTFPVEIWTTGQYFFYDPQHYDQKVVEKKWTEEAKAVLLSFARHLEAVENLDRDAAQRTLQAALDEHGINIGKIMQALRLAITGAGSGPDLMGIMAVLGKATVIKRLNTALSTIQV